MFPYSARHHKSSGHAVYQGKLMSDPVMPLLCNRHQDRAAHRLLGKQENGATKLNLRILGKMV